jgi:predicted TIM-barrel fold metal-dependent hydrolase
LRGIAKKLAANFSPEGDIILPKQTVKLYKDPDNESVATALKEHPDRFLGWIFVNPNGKNDILQEYEKWKDTPGFIGVKAHPWRQFSEIDFKLNFKTSQMSFSKRIQIPDIFNSTDFTN